jgi:hypothetical protein
MDHCLWNGEWIDLYYKGSTALQEFLFTLLEEKKRFNGYTIIAHNMRGYDGVFILKQLINNSICPQVIVKGQKIMSMTVPGFGLRFIDSFNFLPMGLAKLPGAFGLGCGAKGYFPHFFNTPENWEYEGNLPEPKYYGVDNMSKSERTQFEEWYNSKKDEGVVFNFQAELASYCEQDVHILTECCLAYRKLMCEETGCDPFAYLTCASVCNAVYRANFMPDEAIARVPPSGYKHARYSEEALEWLEYVKEFEGVPNLRHAANSERGEMHIGKYFVDGFDKNSNTIFEYHGCFFHGCQKCYPPDTRNPITRKLLFQSWRDTFQREAMLRKMGYNLKSIWGCQWKAMKEEDPEVEERVKLLAIPSPMNPRDAFFGGRTEAFKLLCDEAPISYEDVT